MQFKVLKYLKNQTLPNLNDKELSLYLQNKLNNLS